MADAEESGAGNAMSPVKLIIIIFLCFMLATGGTIAALFMAGVFDRGADGGGATEKVVEEKVSEAIYIPLEPAFVVNFAQGSKARFLQVTLEVMTRRPEVEQQLGKHMPVIRNNLLLLFSSQTQENVSTLDGKEALRNQALETVQGILEQETGDTGIEAVYFTSFVMQ